MGRPLPADGAAVDTHNPMVAWLGSPLVWIDGGNHGRGASGNDRQSTATCWLENGQEVMVLPPDAVTLPAAIDAMVVVVRCLKIKMLAR